MTERETFSECHPLANEIGEAYGEMTPQLKAAASYVLKNPNDVAFLSMRDQAHKAGVSHSTMVRLAHFLGYEGFEQLRECCVEALRSTRLEYLRLGDQNDGRCPPLSEIINFITDRVLSLGDGENLSNISVASDVLAATQNIISLESSSGFGFINHFIQSLSARGNQVKLRRLNPGVTHLSHAAQKDCAVLVANFSPPSNSLIDMLHMISERGKPVVAVTSGRPSPLEQFACATVVIQKESINQNLWLLKAHAAAEIMASQIRKKTENNFEVSTLLHH